MPTLSVGQPKIEDAGGCDAATRPAEIVLSETRLGYFLQREDRRSIQQEFVGSQLQSHICGRAEAETQTAESPQCSELSREKCGCRLEEAGTKQLAF